MILRIKNMESSRCKIVVKNELNKLQLIYKTVELGTVELRDAVSEENIRLIDIALRNVGLELMIDERTRLIEETKAAIHQWIYLSNETQKSKFSEYISKKVNRKYSILSSLFSSVMGITIEKYIIAQKIQRVKEILVYSKSSLSDIAYTLQYSSVAHLSNQFKKVTGLTPSFFRLLRGDISR